MFKKTVRALATASGISLIALTSVASAQGNEYRQYMEADDFSLWNSGESQGVAFNVWRRKGKSGGGFYYFLWKSPYAAVADRGDPEVVVFFDSNIAQLNSDFLVDCYQDGAYDSACQKPKTKPPHYRYTGSCIFPWQTATDGFSCGESATILRPGIFE